MRYEVIFQSLNGHSEAGDCTRWLDYCRETAPAANRQEAEEWASKQCWNLESRSPWQFRYRIEEWREP